MHIRVLQQFVSSLQAPLKSVGATGEVETLAAALEPFAEWDVPTFSGFLEAAEAYRRDGAVRVPAPEDASLIRLNETFAAIRDGVKQGCEGVLERQKDASAILAKIGQAVGLTVSAKVDKKWLDRQHAAARSEELVRRVRELASRIIGPESYAAPELQSDLDAVDSLSAADWKLLDQALGTKSTGKGRAKAESLLARLSGHQPPKKVKAKAAKASPSPEQILPYVQRLKDRMERSNDRDLFPRMEVDEQIRELDALDKDMVSAILREASFPVGPKETKPKMLEKLRDFLDAGHRAFERIQA